MKKTVTKMDMAFDIPEIKVNMKSQPMVDKVRQVTVESSVYTTVNGKKCSGKNQKIVGRFYNGRANAIQVEGMTTAKRPGLDMAISSLGLTNKVKAFQENGKVYLKKI